MNKNDTVWQKDHAWSPNTIVNILLEFTLCFFYIESILALRQVNNKEAIVECKFGNLSSSITLPANGKYIHYYDIVGMYLCPTYGVV